MFGRGRNIGFWVAIGIGAGAIFGASTDAIGFWMAGGAVVGAIIGAFLPRRRS